MRYGRILRAKAFFPESEIFWQALIRTLAMHKRKERGTDGSDAQLSLHNMEVEAASTASRDNWWIT